MSWNALRSASDDCMYVHILAMQVAALVHRREPMDWSSIMKRKLVSKEMKVREDFSAASSPRKQQQRRRQHSDADVTTLSLPDTEDGAIDMTIVHRIAAEEMMDRAELKVPTLSLCVDEPLQIA